MPSTIQMMSQNKNLLPDVPSGSSLLFLNEDDGRFWLKTPDGNFIPSSNNLPELEEGKYLKVEGGVLVWADGGSGGGLVNVTYSELRSKISSEELIPGTFYKITNYATTYGIIDYNGINVVCYDVKTGDVEPLIVLATGTNKISDKVWSENHPYDEIIYDIFDDSAEDGTWDPVQQKYSGGTPRTGKITFRKDTKLHLSAYYDWRQVKIRRWTLDAQPWVYGNSYSKGVLVTALDLNIYISIKDITSSTIDPTDPSQTEWCKWHSYIHRDYRNVGFSSFPQMYNGVGGLIDTTSLLIDVNNYEDFYTFSFVNEINNSSGISTINPNKYYFNVEIGPTKEFVIAGNSLTVFLTNASSINKLEHIFIENSIFNTFIITNNFYNVTIKEKCVINIFKMTNFTKSIIKNCENNVGTESIRFFEVNSNLKENGITNIQSTKVYNCTNNYFINYITTCDLGTIFTFNMLKNFSNNTFTTVTSNNQFGDNFEYNKSLGNFENNTIGMNCSYNSFGSIFKDNVIGNEFKYNTMLYSFSQKTVENNFLYNIFETDIPVSFTFSSTLFPVMYEDMNVWVYKNRTSGGINDNYKLRYFDEYNALIIENIII